MILLPTLTLLTAALPQGGAAGHHPPESVLYLEVPDLPGALDAYTRTALVATLADPALSEAVGEALGHEEFNLVALAKDAYEQAVQGIPQLPDAGHLLFEPLRGVSLSVSAPNGSLTPILVRAMEGRGLEDLVQEVTFQLELEMESEEAATRLLDAFVARSRERGIDVKQKLYSEGRSFRPDSGDPFDKRTQIAQGGRYLAVFFGPGTPVGWFDRLAGRSAGLKLEAPGTFTAEGTTVFRYHATFQEELFAMADWTEFSPLIELAEGLAGPVVPLLLRGGDWRVTIDPRGRVITEGLYPRGKRPLDRVLGDQPLPGDVEKYLHPDAVVGWATSFNGEPLGEWLRTLALPNGSNMMDGLEERYGFRPDRDLVAPLGSAMVYSLPQPKTLLAAPPLTIAFALDDGEAFEKGMDGLERALSELFGRRLQLSVGEYRGMRMYSLEIDWRALGMRGDFPVNPSAFIKPTLVIAPDRVFLSTLPSQAKREIRRLRASAEESGPSREFPDGVSSFGFADWPRFAGKLYDTARATLPMIGALSSEEFPIDVGALPPSEVLLSHFAESRRWRRPRGEGQVEFYQESSFGPETAFLGGFALSVMVAQSQRSAQIYAIETENEAQARAGVVQLEADIQMFKIDQGRWPRDWEDLCAHCPLDHEPIRTDPWGGAYHFQASDAGIVVWCDGPNGINEQGQGDDIVVR